RLRGVQWTVRIIAQQRRVYGKYSFAHSAPHTSLHRAFNSNVPSKATVGSPFTSSGCARRNRTPPHVESNSTNHRKGFRLASGSFPPSRESAAHPRQLFRVVQMERSDRAEKIKLPRGCPQPRK